MNDATSLADWLVAELIGRGTRHVVLCPGSRNAPLSFALARAAEREDLTLYSRIDERTAAFLALGIARTTREPVAVVTTSGTAAANLHPAILEAAHSGLALIAITADRPASLRGTGANQTTDQVGIFGTAASCVDLFEPDRDALDAAWHLDGPVHLNAQFSPPLTPDQPTSQLAAPIPNDDEDGKAATRLPTCPRTVVIAGDDAGPKARVLAESGNWPLLAEPTSGARTGANAIRTYRLLLGGELASQVERCVVVGHPTLNRSVTQLLEREDIEVISVRARGRWPSRPFPVAAEVDAVDVAGAGDPGWLDKWRSADQSLSGRLDEFVGADPDLTPYEVAAAVSAAVPPRGLLFVGASNPIRDLDLMARPYPVGERRLVIANRGLAGIDGTLSSAIGAALGRAHTTRAICYVGDVTFLHDLTALVIGPEEQRPDLTIVVANDNGGSIFATLEQGSEEYAASYDLLFGTPHGADLSALCNGLGVPHWRVRERAELEHALANPNGGIEVIEATIRRDNRRELDLAIKELV